MFDLLSEYTEKRLEKKSKGKVFVRYSCFGKDKKNVPVNNLDVVAVEGKVKFYQKYDPFDDCLYFWNRFGLSQNKG